MGSDFEIAFITDAEIKKRASSFLQQYYPRLTIPIPIEEIVEFQMGIDIIPLPGLHQVLEVEGFTSSDLSNIYVDEFTYTSRPGRYRFTLAHEIGHVILHKEIYKKAQFRNSQEWKRFINGIPDQSHSRLEYQAYAFGGLILVPVESLKRLTNKYVKHIQVNGISLKKNWDYAWYCIEDQLAKDFAVSTQVIEKRLTKEGLRELYR